MECGEGGGDAGPVQGGGGETSVHHQLGQLVHSPGLGHSAPGQT